MKEIVYIKSLIWKLNASCDYLNLRERVGVLPYDVDGDDNDGHGKDCCCAEEMELLGVNSSRVRWIWDNPSIKDIVRIY